jgi:uncharacterized membrane protein
MRLYLANSIYYATQAEAKKAASAAKTDWVAVDFPARQADIIAFLNRKARRAAAPVDDARDLL